MIRVFRRGHWPVRGSQIFKVLSRVWVLLVISIVMIIGGVAVSRIRGFFGTEENRSYADSNLDTGKSFHPKSLIYEVFGPPGTVAEISYYDINAEPQVVNGADLPWAVQLTTNLASLTGNIAVQGDSDTIGCRIIVDGKIRAERITTGKNAFTYCVVKAA